jgi:hypothetical protein
MLKFNKCNDHKFIYLVTKQTTNHFFIIYNFISEQSQTTSKHKLKTATQTVHKYKVMNE